MDKTREQAEKLQVPKSGPARDVQNVKQGTAASIAELREFVSNLKSRSPQEVLGIVAASGLAKGILHATLGCALLLVVLTVIPYAIADDSAELELIEIAAQQKADREASAAEKAAADAKAETADADTKTVAENQADAASKMGIDRVAEPNTEPPDPLDKFLDRD
jgi:hypothetical protein